MKYKLLYKFPLPDVGLDPLNMTMAIPDVDNDEDPDKIYRNVFYKFLGPSFSILGIIGNICCLLAIWYRRHRIKSSNSNVQVQASHDTGMGGRMYAYLLGKFKGPIIYLLLL